MSGLKNFKQGVGRLFCIFSAEFKFLWFFPYIAAQINAFKS
jgi:hypothetical protein